MKVLENKELNGLELYFNEKPESQIITALKQNGFRWHNVKKCWYNKISDEVLALVKQLSNGLLPIENISKNEQIKPYQRLKTRLEAFKKNFKNIENNYTMEKQLATLCRQLVKEYLKECKFSITTKNSLNIHFISSPYQKNSLEYNLIKDTIYNTVKSFQYCHDYDPYADYNSWNFYFHISDWEYTQTEQTTDQLEDIKLNELERIEEEKQQAEQKEKDFQEYLIKRAEEEAQYKIREAERQKEIEYINNNVVVTPLKENEHYIIKNIAFPSLNKNDTLNEYLEQLETPYNEEREYKNYNICDCKVTKEINFTNEKAYNYFINNLLSDFDFLVDEGGTYTDDPRAENMSQLTKDEKESIKWINLVVVVKLNGENKFYIDPQGYNYARYCGFDSELVNYIQALCFKK